MPGPRDYTRRTLMALAHYSGGLCYCPGCPEPVLREVDGKIHLIVQIAHIHGAYPGSRRFDPLMTDDQRRDTPNLLLLCDPHHQQVDSKEKEETYTPDMLRRWKTLRESDPREALKRLREVSPAALQKIVAAGLAQHDTKLLSALDRLEANDKEAAALMRSLVDELTEAYSRIREGINMEIMEQFAMAVRRLPSAEHMETFARAADRLYRIRETLDNFDAATYRLRERSEFGDY